jgi:ribose transport system substrate-binding protein
VNRKLFSYKVLISALILMSLAVLVSCRKIEKKKFLIGFSQSTMIDPWRINMLEQMKDAVKKNEDAIDFIFTDGQNDNMKQISDVEDLFSRGIDLLIISPREADPLTPVVERIFREGIPVITLDRNITTDSFTCFIGASNFRIGEEAGKLMASLLKGKGSVIEIEGILGATPTIDRSDGFHSVIDSYPGIQVTGKQPADYLREPALKIMEDFLQSQPQIDGVYAHNDEMALGALAALKGAGREGVIIIGIDGQREAFEAIMAGKMTATFIYPNGSAQAVDTALKILRGEKVPNKIELKTQLVDKANVHLFYNPKSYF